MVWVYSAFLLESKFVISSSMIKPNYLNFENKSKRSIGKHMGFLKIYNLKKFLLM